jgi:hypothetical protein
VPARNVLGAGSENEVSATDIRAIIQDDYPVQRAAVIDHLVLNPHLLEELVKERGNSQARLLI